MSCDRWRIGIPKSAGLLLELLLPGVEREMAERARRHHRVGAGLRRLLDRLDQLAERDLLAGLDDREAAALDLRRVVDRLAAAGLDDRLERPGLVGILEAQDLRRPQDLAAVERRDLEALEALVRDLLEPLVAVALGDQPEEVLDLDAALYGGAPTRSRFSFTRASRPRRLADEVRLPQVERADVADRHQRVRAGLLRVGEDARVQVQVVVGLGLVDVAGAAAGDRLELDRARARASARAPSSRCRAPSPRAPRGSPCSTRPSSWSPPPSSDSCWNSIRPARCSPWTIPSAPSRPCALTRSRSSGPP